MKKLTTGKAYLETVACYRACGHWKAEKRWVYSYADACQLIRNVLGKYPCDSCMVAMTRINNQVIEGKAQ